MQDLLTFIANHMALSYAFTCTLVLLTLVEYLRMKRNHFCITPGQAVQLINKQNATILDIRANEHYRKGHIIDAQSLAANEVMKNTKKLEKFKTRPVIIVCGSGLESQKIAASLLKRGYNAFSLSGGIRSWSEAELPLVKE